MKKIDWDASLDCRTLSGLNTNKGWEIFGEI